MQIRLLLDVIVRQSAVILKLLACEEQSLLFWWDSLFVLNLGFDVLNGGVIFYLKGDCLANQVLNKDLHYSENQVKGRLLLNVIVSKSIVILQLIAIKE